VAVDGWYRYRVSSRQIVSPTDLSIHAPTTRQSLTPVTCYPFSMIGHSPNRFIVRAQLVGRAGGDDGAGRDDMSTRASGSA
jgi:sortase (surface protein transpeptidase)